MLLSEISQISHKQIARKHPDKVIGTGIQGTALRTNKTNTIRKVYGLDSLQDPYYLYIELIRQHQDNPFFPRIYRHIVYKNKPFRGSLGTAYGMVGVVLMEKLIPIDASGGKIDPNLVRALFSNLGVEYNAPIDLYSIFQYRTNLQRIINTTPNQQFADALRVLVNSGRKLYDLHAGNWMLRLTGAGPQLVILDPVYGSDVSTAKIPDDSQLELAHSGKGYF